MDTEKVVIFGRNRYEFVNVERATEARDWIAAQGVLADPAEFADKFRQDCVQLPGPLGGSSFR